MSRVCVVMTASECHGRTAVDFTIFESSNRCQILKLVSIRPANLIIRVELTWQFVRS